MGVYDSFLIDYPLPIEPWIPEKYKPFIYYTFQADGFQSKDLECCLKSFYISNDGHIFEDIFGSFEVDKQPFERKQIYYHGHIRVYTPVYLDDDKEETRGPILWFEYDLKFTDSLLVNAKMVSPTQKDLYELHRNI
jgi:hypothetical protein